MTDSARHQATDDTRPECTTWQASITVENKEWARREATREGVTIARWLNLVVRRKQESAR